MNNDLENKFLVDSKRLPKEYLILKLRMSFNKELFENKIISFDIYNKMQRLLMKKMNEIILNNSN